ncbi:MAG: Tat pathway signal protein, partial [Verrucomicrobiia bacterium]
DLNKVLSSSQLVAEWRPDILQGVTVIKGAWNDGSPMLAIPYYARLNRTPDQVGTDRQVSQTSAAPNPAQVQNTNASASTGPQTGTRSRRREVNSMVWIKDE